MLVTLPWHFYEILFTSWDRYICVEKPFLLSLITKVEHWIHTEGSEWKKLSFPYQGHLHKAQAHCTTDDAWLNHLERINWSTLERCIDSSSEDFHLILCNWSSQNRKQKQNVEFSLNTERSASIKRFGSNLRSFTNKCCWIQQSVKQNSYLALNIQNERY